MWDVLTSRVKLLGVRNATKDKKEIGTKPRCSKYDDGYTDALRDVLDMFGDIQRQELRAVRQSPNKLVVTIK